MIHYVLGNIDRVRIWLSDGLTEYGWVHMLDRSIDLLAAVKPKTFLMYFMDIMVKSIDN